MRSEVSLKTRLQCPICSESEASFLCRMGKDYLLSGKQGWQYDPAILRLAGISFDEDSEEGCSYYECINCGTFYLKEVPRMEHAIAVHQKEDSPYVPPSSLSVVPKAHKTAHVSAQMVMFALESTGSNSATILDYGFGGGFDLGILRALGAEKVVGYNPHEYAFDFARKRVHPDLTLVSTSSDLATHAPFDAVRCNSVLEHAEDPVAILDHIYELLKPGGMAWFVAPSHSRKVMKRYVQSVQEGIKVKELHPGHLQLWNNDTLTLPSFAQRRGFEPVYVDLGIRSRNIKGTKDLLWLMAAHAKKSMDAARAAVAIRTGRYKTSACLVRKPT